MTDTRRQFLKATGLAATGTVAALAGCSGGDGGDGGDGGTDGGDGSTGDGGDGGGEDGETTTRADEQDPLRVGYLSWLSGVFAGAGVDHREAFDLRVDEINNSGGVNGHTLEVIHKDTKATPETGVERARELVTQENVDILTGLTTSSTGKAVTEFAKSQQIPFLVGGAQTPDITKDQCNEYTYRCCGNIISQMTALAEGVNQLAADDLTTVAGVNPDYVYGHQCWEYFKQEFKKRRPDVEFVGSTFPAFGKGDYAKEIQATIDKEPDIVHSVLYSGDMISFVKQAQQYSFFEEIPEFAAAALDASISSMGDAWPSGLIGQNPTQWNWTDNEQAQEFFTKYVDRYGRVPSGFYSGYGEVNAQALKGAVEKGGGVSKNELLEGMNDLTFESVATEAHIRPSDHQAFRETYAVGRYGSVERSLVSSKDVQGWTDIVTMPGSTIEEVDQDACEAF